MLVLTLLLSLLSAVSSHKEIASWESRVTFYTVDYCEDCEAARPSWLAITERGIQGIIFKEVNCDHEDRICLDNKITTLPSILFTHENGMRDMLGSFNEENILKFIEDSEATLVRDEQLLTTEENGIIHLEESNLDLLGKSHALVYFMYDEEVSEVEELVTGLRYHVGELFKLPVYIIDCGTLADICVKEPFKIQMLPCIKYLGETVHTYTGDFLLDRIDNWLHVAVFQTREPDLEYMGDLVTEPDEKLVYISTQAEHDNIAYMEGVLLAFYLTDDSGELEDLFKELSKKHRNNKDIQIFAIRCDEYNAPKACKTFDELPTVQHGFMGRLAKELSLRTEPQFDTHIEKLLKILAEGGHILEGNDEVQQGEKIEEPDTPERSGHALIINSDNYNSTLSTHKLVFLKFFVPWCGHCQKLKPTWKLLAETFREVSDIVIGMVNCQNEQEICRKHLVYGYPTLFTFIEGKQTYRYREEKTLNTMISHVKEKYYQSVEDDLKYGEGPLKLTGNNVWNVLGVRKFTMAFYTADNCEACDKNHFYFHETWKAVRSQPPLEEKIMLASVNCNKDLKLCKEMGVTQVPFIVLYDIDERIAPGAPPTDPILTLFKAVQTQINSSPDHMTLDTIAWNTKHKKTKEESVVKRSAEPAHNISPEEEGLETRPSPPPKTEPVTELTSDSFRAQLKKSRFTLVKFYTPWCGHCRKLAPVWAELGDKWFLEADLVMAKVNCDAEEKLCDKHDVTVYPTIFMFENDRKLKHVCKKRKKEDLISFTEKFLRSEPLIVAAQVKTSMEEAKRNSEKRLDRVEGTVKQLDKAALEALLQDNSEQFLIVLFYHGSDQKGTVAMLDTWQRLANIYISEKRLSIAQSDCDTELRLCIKHQATGRTTYPQIILFDKVNNISHECVKRGEYDLINYIDSYLEENKQTDKTTNKHEGMGETVRRDEL